MGKWLKRTNSTTPRIYALPKIHKPDTPFRPIVSSIDGPTYKLSSYLHRVISKGSTGFFSAIKDSFEFSTYIQNIILPEGYLIISLDVTSLFTNVPLELVKAALRRREKAMELTMPVNELIKTVEFIMSTTTFTFGKNHYKQIYGLPMGSPLAPTLADIVMQDLEFICWGELDFHIPFYKRYVDDIILAVPADKVQKVVKIFNSYHPRLKFTYEIEDNGQIPFLDLLLIRREDKIITDWYRKPTWSGRYLNYYSHNPLTQKRGVVFMMVDRAWKLGHPEFLRKNLDLIIKTLKKNDYPNDFIQHWIDVRIKQLKKYGTINVIGRSAEIRGLQ